MSTSHRTPMAGPPPRQQTFSSTNPQLSVSANARSSIGTGHVRSKNRTDGEGEQVEVAEATRDVKENDEDHEQHSSNSNTTLAATRHGVPPLACIPLSVTKRHDHHGLLEYTVKWEPTVHLTAELQSEICNDRLKVYMGRKWWRVKRFLDVPVENGSPKTQVHWKSTTQPIWKLPSAFNAMAQYDRAHPRPAKTFDLGRWGLHIVGVRDPEPETAINRHGVIEDDVFVPERGIDYTVALLEKAQAQLSDGGLRYPSVLEYLNMPRRQRLKFSNSFTREGRTWDLSRSVKFRAAFVHVAGHAQTNACWHCVEMEGPFTKCVTLRDVFEGACTNCAVAGRGTQCEYHNKLVWKMNVRPDAVDDGGQGEVDTGTPAEVERSTLSATANMSALGISDAAAVRTTTVSHSIRPPAASNYSVLPSSKPAQVIDLSSPEAGPSKRRKRSETEGDEANEILPWAKKRATPSSETGHPPPPLMDMLGTMYHLQCRLSGQTCIHPDIGFVLPVNLTNYDRFTVYNDQVFGKGELTRDQVKFIVSCSPCGLAMKLSEGWEDVRHILGMPYATKWELSADLYYDLLGIAVKRFCPFRPGYVIDLCDE